MTSTLPVTLDSTGAVAAHVEQLRTTGAARVTLMDGLEAWAITDTTIIKDLLTSPNVSRDPRQHWKGFNPATMSGWLVPWVSPSMFNAYGPDHRRLRKMIAAAFTARRVRDFTPAITSIVNTHLDRLATRSPGPVDLRRDYSLMIPLNVICDLLGVPTEQRPKMLHVMETTVDTSLSPKDAAANSDAMVQAMIGLAAWARKNPGDNLITTLLDAGDDEQRLTEEELLATLILIVGAGSETTVAAINHTIVNLLTHPEALATVRADPARLADAVEESLRHDPPVSFLPLRYAVEDLNLTNGIHIAAGEPIIIGFGAPGRDPNIHHDPTTWDIDRADKEHLAFGYGIHHCLGASLARQETLIAVSGILQRFPDVRLAVPAQELRRKKSFITNDFEMVPLTLGARGLPE